MARRDRHRKREGIYDQRPLAPGATLADYARIFSAVFVPAIRAHRPDLVLVSAGQDALADDEHGRMLLSPPDYGVLTRMLLDLDLPLALVLEGGYGPSHGQAIAAIFTTLRGREKRTAIPGGRAPEPSDSQRNCRN